MTSHGFLPLSNYLVYSWTNLISCSLTLFETCTTHVTFISIWYFIESFSNVSFIDVASEMWEEASSNSTTSGHRVCMSSLKTCDSFVWFSAYTFWHDKRNKFFDRVQSFFNISIAMFKCSFHFNQMVQPQTVVITKCSITWDIVPCSQLQVKAASMILDFMLVSCSTNSSNLKIHTDWLSMNYVTLHPRRTSSPKYFISCETF